MPFWNVTTLERMMPPSAAEIVPELVMPPENSVTSGAPCDVKPTRMPMPLVAETRPALVMPPLNVGPVMAIAVFWARTLLVASIEMPPARVPALKIWPLMVLLVTEMPLEVMRPAAALPTLPLTAMLMTQMPDKMPELVTGNGPL
jgi:hypothetical protein